MIDVVRNYNSNVRTLFDENYALAATQNLSASCVPFACRVVADRQQRTRTFQRVVPRVQSYLLLMRATVNALRNTSM